MTNEEYEKSDFQEDSFLMEQSSEANPPSKSSGINVTGSNINLNDRIDRLDHALRELHRRLFKNFAMLNNRNKKDLDEILDIIQGIDTTLTLRADSLEKRVEVLEEPLRLESNEKQRIINTWKNASLLKRILFIMELLAEDHPLYEQLRKIKGLEELRLRGDSLISWIKNYPEIFVDGALEALVLYPDISDCEVNGDISILAYETLQETRKGFADYFRDHSLEWILPSPGERVTLEHKIEAKEESDLRRDSVARLLRPGFRIKGKLMLPANIAVAIPRKTASVPPAENEIESENTPSVTQPPQPAKVWPYWRNKLIQGKMGLDSTRIDKWIVLLENLTNLSDPQNKEELIEALHPLRPILKSSPSWGEEDPPAEWIATFKEAREEITGWLKEKLKVELIIPHMDDLFEEPLMIAIGERRTFIPDYDNKVARVENIGVSHDGDVLCKAEVVRYKKE